MSYNMTHKNLNKFNFTVIAGDVTLFCTGVKLCRWNWGRNV